jgi:hypothetical protein
MISVLSVTLPVFAFITTGMLSARLKLLGPGATDVLNRFVVCLALPALLFDAMARVRWADVAHVGFLAALGGGMVVTFVVATTFGRAGGRSLADRSIQGLGASFSNAGFMGIPLCRLALGEESVVPAVMATVLTASVLFGCAIGGGPQARSALSAGERDADRAIGGREEPPVAEGVRQRQHGSVFDGRGRRDRRGCGQLCRAWVRAIARLAPTRPADARGGWER